MLLSDIPPPSDEDAAALLLGAPRARTAPTDSFAAPRAAAAPPPLLVLTVELGGGRTARCEPAPATRPARPPLMAHGPELSAAWRCAGATRRTLRPPSFAPHTTCRCACWASWRRASAPRWQRQTRTLTPLPGSTPHPSWTRARATARHGPRRALSGARRRAASGCTATGWRASAPLTELRPPPVRRASRRSWRSCEAGLPSLPWRAPCRARSRRGSASLRWRRGQSAR